MLDQTRSIAKPAAVRRRLPHDSADLHVSGEALYVDDLPEPRDVLHIALVKSEQAHAGILTVDNSAARSSPGVIAVLDESSVPAINDCSPTVGGDPVFVSGGVEFHGQIIVAVAAETLQQARDACQQIRVQYDPLPAILSVPDAIERESWVLPTTEMKRGDPESALAAAQHRIQGNLKVGGQDHFYLEGQVSMAVPTEAGTMQIFCSTQHPSEIQLLVSKVLGKKLSDITVEVRRMGGGFGGKETQAAQSACIAATTAHLTGRPAKLRLDRDSDMIATGKRHSFEFDYDVGFSDTGRIKALQVQMASNCGYSADLSGPINDRALLHIDNAYFLEHVFAKSYRCKTNTVSNTAFRGFGAPQAMMCIERIMDEIASNLKLDPLQVRRVNFYGGRGRNLTPYRMQVKDFVADKLFSKLEATSEYHKRREQIRAENLSGGNFRRGIAMTPVKFGISFTMTHYNQAGALVHLYTDGSIHLNHGGTEMGQGLFIKVAQVVADEFSVPLERVKIKATDTSKVPNTSATAASSGSDINGKAAQQAARKIKMRLSKVAAMLFDVDENFITYESGMVYADSHAISFDDLVAKAHRARVSLSATGHYKTPKIHWDRTTMTGRPFYYFGYGAAVSEVVIDCLTGETRLLRVDILHDVGRSLNPAVDLGQVEGGFVQGVGWLTSEELWWDKSGALRTHAPSTYKIPTSCDVPEEFNVHLWDGGYNPEKTIYRSKAVGEPPLMLSISVFSAISDAISSCSDYRRWPQLDAPATPERVLCAVQQITNEHSSS